jgi:ribosomal protein L28
LTKTRIYGKFIVLIKRRDIMAKNESNRKPNIKNIRSHALNATKKKQKLNLQVVTLENGEKVKLSAKEIRNMKKN